MSENVVGIRPGHDPEGSEPNPKLLAFVRGILERVELGETVAVAMIEVHPDVAGNVSYGYSMPRSNRGDGHAVISALYTLQRRIDDEQCAAAPA